MQCAIAIYVYNSEGLIFLTKTATLWSDCVNDLPSISINVDLPAPGAPEKPILRERGPRGIIVNFVRFLT